MYPVHIFHHYIIWYQPVFIIKNLLNINLNKFCFNVFGLTLGIFDFLIEIEINYIYLCVLFITEYLLFVWLNLVVILINIFNILIGTLGESLDASEITDAIPPKVMEGINKIKKPDDIPHIKKWRETCQANFGEQALKDIDVSSI